MCKTSKLATSFQTMQKYGVVFVSKTLAVDFLTFCKMAEAKVSYSLSGNKIKFDLLDK